MESKNTVSFAIHLLSISLFFSLVSAIIIPTSDIPGSSIAVSNITGICDGLKLGLCVNVMNMVEIVIGSPPVAPCCPIIFGLVELEAGLRVCTHSRANIMGMNINIPVTFSLVFNNCNKLVPSGFEI